MHIILMCAAYKFERRKDSREGGIPLLPPPLALCRKKPIPTLDHSIDQKYFSYRNFINLLHPTHYVTLKIFSTLIFDVVCHSHNESTLYMHMMIYVVQIIFFFTTKMLIIILLPQVCSKIKVSIKVVQCCYQFTVIARLAPKWNLVTDWIIQGTGFVILSMKNKHCAQVNYWHCWSSIVVA